MGRLTDYETQEEIGLGGCARVFRGIRKVNGEVVALKMALDDDWARKRMKREIREQAQIEHENVIPILDHDLHFRWFAMPLASGNLEQLRESVSREELVTVVDSVARGLDAAHARGLVHRDVTPRNILAFELPDPSARLWRIGDWGMVRRARGFTTALLTEVGSHVGTDGFAAPEQWDAAHEAGPEADVYGLGRVVAWVETGKWPIPNVPLLPDGRWRHFVRETTQLERTRRVPTMFKLLEMLNDVRGAVKAQTQLIGSASDRAEQLRARISNGDIGALDTLVALALDNIQDADLFIDQVAELDAKLVADLVATRPDDVQRMLEAMGEAATGANWGQRDYNYANTPLRWVFNVARAAERQGLPGLLEDASAALFSMEVLWDRFDQRSRSRDWLLALRGEDAETVGRALRRHPRASLWYVKEGWSARRAAAPIKSAIDEAVAGTESTRE